MRVEVITPSADPDRGGFGIRVHGLVSMFAQFADVRVLVAGSNNGARVPQARYTWMPMHDSLRTRMRRMRTYYRDAFPKRDATDPPDLVVVESLDLLGLHQFGPDVPLLLDEHNVYWNLLQYEIHNSPFFRGRLGRRPAVRRVLTPTLLERAKRFEVQAIRRSSRTLVTSEVDRQTIAAECPDVASRVRVLPNSIDVQSIPPLPDPPDSRTVAFLGDFNYVPNLEAAAFVQRVLSPGVPTARFLLVGPNPPSGPRATNVIATGYVPDVLTVLRDTSVCIAPLFHGSGTRIKILTYLAASRPVVATTKACEGLPVQDGRHLLIRDEPMDFRAAVEGLLQDPEARHRLGAEGRKLVQSQFDWRVHVPALRALASEIRDESA